MTKTKDFNSVDDVYALSFNNLLIQKAILRFNSRVKKALDNECWPFDNYPIHSYGQFSIKGVVIQSHVFALAIKLGYWPLGMACHTCDAKHCCNPNHVYDGSAVSNAKDAIDRHRYSQHRGFALGHTYNQFLSDEDVRGIRQLSQQYTHQKIATMFNVSRPTITQIVNGDRRSNVV